MWPLTLEFVIGSATHVVRLLYEKETSVGTSRSVIGFSGLGRGQGGARRPRRARMEFGALSLTRAVNARE